MKIVEILRMVDETIDNMISDSSKIAYINELEQSIYQEEVNEMIQQTQNIIKDQKEYELLDKYRFEDIISVVVDETEYIKTNLNNLKNDSFYKTSGGLSLQPSPLFDITDGLNVIYRKKPNLKTVSSMNTDEASLIEDFGERWYTLYEFFLKWKMSTELDDFLKANNWAVLYDAELSKFKAWYEINQPEYSAETLSRSW